MNNNVHVLEQLIDSDIVFVRFVVNGDEVEVTKYINSDLMNEITVTRATARNMWKEIVQQGFKTV
jgi:hypothetical protein